LDKLSESLVYELVTTPRQLSSLVEKMQQADWIGFDTEFVSEDCFEPDLCLIQVMVGGEIFLIDPFAVGDTQPFWQQLADGQHVTVAHAAREEYRFCHRYAGRPPANLVDTQVAAAMVALEYPAAYSTLVTRFVGRTVSKGETRTNWRKRPLNESQLDYAARDVIYLPEIYRSIRQSLEQRGRWHWLLDEMQGVSVRYLDDPDEERWRRVSGTSNMKPQELAIIRNLYQWRLDAARRRNQPARRVLRDDLMIEIARLKTDQPLKIRGIRGMNFSRHQNDLQEIAQQVGAALALSQEQWPGTQPRRANHSKLAQVIQFAQTALGIVCRREQVAPALVGTTQDLRDLVAWTLGQESAGRVPLLDTGWRKEVVGDVIIDLLAGKVAIKITNPTAEYPLEFERTQ